LAQPADFWQRRGRSHKPTVLSLLSAFNAPAMAGADGFQGCVATITE
jgi:hypothetical protein